MQYPARACARAMHNRRLDATMIIALVLFPFLAGLFCFWLGNDLWRRLLLIAVAAVELCLSILCWFNPPAPFRDLLALDALGLLVFTVTSVLFLGISVYAYGYLREEKKHTVHGKRSERRHFSNLDESIFTACLLFFFASAVLVCLSQHFGLLWVGIEATTIATAPLIYFHRHQYSLEATWKYLIICSVGIAMALLGTFLLNVSWQTGPGAAIPMTFAAMIENASGTNELWFKIAFIFMFIGYGTKTGLAPMHPWLPDAHSEAPSLASALLSGALLNCALLGLLRLYRVSVAAGFQDFCSELFIIFGLFSMLVAAFFILGQGSFKRLLAYSSVEHMGIVLLGVGVSGIAAYGSMIHLICHSLTKAAMFLLAGNFLACYGGHLIQKITGSGKILPVSSILWMAGFLALCGVPPFGIFISEFTILRGMTAAGLSLAAFLYLLSLGLVFIGMASTCLHMVYGRPREGAVRQEEKAIPIVPPLVLVSLCLMFGLYQPQWLRESLESATRCIIGG